MCVMTAEEAKDIAETIALVSAAGFFIYKAVSGYLYIDMSLTISSERSHASDHEDLLAVTARLKKGSRAAFVFTTPKRVPPSRVDSRSCHLPDFIALVTLRIGRPPSSARS